jgi:hypothetical protein
MFKKTVITLLAVAIFVVPALAEYEVIHKPYGTLNVLGLMQARHAYTFTGDMAPDTSSFNIARARIGVKGTVYDFGSYYVLYEVANQNHLLDAYGRLDFAPVGIQIGQFKQPFGIEYLQSSGKILTINRALVTTSRDACVACTPGYDIGLGLDAKFNFGEYGWVKPVLTAYNGTGRNVGDDNNAKDIAFGLFANPINMEFFKGFQIFGGYVMSKPAVPNLMSISDSTSYGGGLSLENPMFTVQGEYLTTTNDNMPATDADDVTYFGYYAQASYRWYTGLDWLHAVEPLVKYDTYDPNDAVENDGVNEITGGINFHFAELHRFKLQINYVKVTDELAAGEEDRDDDKVLTQLSVFF